MGYRWTGMSMIEGGREGRRNKMKNHQTVVALGVKKTRLGVYRVGVSKNIDK